jgi:Arc/MetJ-type ribon-helix-helix transcriptional regulator
MSSDDIDRKPLVNLRVNREQKEKWEDYVDGSDLYSSLSDLIRKAVEKEISRDSEESPTGGVMVDEVQTELSSLSEDIEQLQKDVSWLRSREEHDVEELAHKLFSTIEPVKATGDDESAKQMGTIAGSNPHTVDALASRLDTTPARVEEALDFLKEQHMPIVRFDIDGETHWFKEE